MHKKPFFYGWVSAAIAFAVVFCSVGCYGNCLSLFIVPLLDHYGISRTLYSLSSILGYVSSAVLSLIYKPVLDRIGIKRSVMLGLGSIALSSVVMASGLGVWTLFLRALLAGLGNVFVSSQAVSPIINRWFNKYRGTVYGIVVTGISLGGAACAPIVGLLIETCDWRLASLAVAAIVAVCIPLVQLLLVSDPKSKGQEPLGGWSEEDREAPEKKQSSGSIGVLSDSRVRLLVAAQFFASFSMTPAFMNIAPHMQGVGFDPLFVSGVILVICYLMNAVSKPLIGMINDQFGSFLVVLWVCSGSIISSVMMSFLDPSSKASAVAAVLVLGFGSPIASVAIPLVAGRALGSKLYISSLGMLMTAVYLGQIGGDYVSSTLYDMTRSYSPSYLLVAFTYSLSFVFLLALIHVGRKQKAASQQNA